MAKKILIFSPPFSGHLNVLKDLIARYQNKFSFHLIITGWKNIEPDLRGVTAPITILAKSNLYETDPAIWTLPRVAELLAQGVSLAKKIKPDLIIYDFFSLEGNLIGQKLGIPSWSSVPALMGPFKDREHLRNKLKLSINTAALESLKKQGAKINARNFEMISDGLHLPGEINLLWSYPSLAPKNMMKSRQKARYIFVGHFKNKKLKEKRKPPLVYFSFGTVVLGNLWNQQNKIRLKLKEFISALAKRLENKHLEVLFTDFNKPILKNYPQNWQVVPRADQIDILRKASIFITHAGSNSFHEAVLARVPMVAIPFFGDQPVIANQISRLGLGINANLHKNIDTKRSKDFLNARLAARVESAIDEILSQPEKYKKNFLKLRLKAENIEKLICLEI